MAESSHRPLQRVAARIAVVAFGLFGVSGCLDAPTSPALAEWLAENGEVAAVLPPEAMPASSEWLEPGGAASIRLVALAEASQQALGRGRVGTAARLRTEAGALAAASLTEVPDARLVRRGWQAVDRWLTAVQAGGGTPSAAARAIVDSVAVGRASASESLAAGDTLAAARTLIRTAEQIRGVAPRLALLRIIDRTDVRVATLGAESREAERARYLVRTARLALDDDDAVRALRRAIYAAQLAGGQKLEEITPDE